MGSFLVYKQFLFSIWSDFVLNSGIDSILFWLVEKYLFLITILSVLITKLLFLEWLLQKLNQNLLY